MNPHYLRQTANADGRLEGFPAGDENEEGVMEDAKRLMLEIRAAEGGADSRLFVAELADAYLRLAAGKG